MEQVDPRNQPLRIWQIIGVIQQTQPLLQYPATEIVLQTSHRHTPTHQLLQWMPLSGIVKRQ